MPAPPAPGSGTARAPTAACRSRPRAISRRAAWSPAPQERVRRAARPQAGQRRPGRGSRARPRAVARERLLGPDVPAGVERRQRDLGVRGGVGEVDDELHRRRRARSPSSEPDAGCRRPRPGPRPASSSRSATNRTSMSGNGREVPQVLGADDAGAGQPDADPRPLRGPPASGEALADEVGAAAARASNRSPAQSSSSTTRSASGAGATISGIRIAPWPTATWAFVSREMARP